jgi:hypothetical protein
MTRRITGPQQQVPEDEEAIHRKVIRVEQRWFQFFAPVNQSVDTYKLETHGGGTELETESCMGAVEAEGDPDASGSTYPANLS